METQNTFSLLYRAEHTTLQNNAPLVIHQAMLLKDVASNQVWAMCHLQVLTDRPMVAAEIELECKDAFGNLLPSAKQQYLDMYTVNGAVFGEGFYISLPDQNTREIQAKITKVRYANGAMEDVAPDGVLISTAQLLTDYFEDQQLAEQYTRDQGPEAVYVPARTDGHLWCACGLLNQGDAEYCFGCGRNIAQLENALDPEVLTQNLQLHQADVQKQLRREEEAAERERRNQEEERRLQQYVEEEEAKAKQNRIIWPIVIAGFAAFLLLWSFVIRPASDYNQATRHLQNKNYDEAIALFADLGNYKDSAELLQESKYQKANWLQEIGTMDAYKNSYLLFGELGSYADSKDEQVVTLILWEAKVLAEGGDDDLQQFTSTVSLQSHHYEMFYSTVVLFIHGHEEASYWCDYGLTNVGYKTITILQMLPSGYENTSTYIQLLEVLRDQSSRDLFEYHSDLARTCWSIPFVQNMAKTDYAIDCFLLGYWSNYSGYYYLNIYRNADENSGLWATWNVPWPNYSRDHWDIHDGVFVFEDSNNNEIAKVYKITIVDYDTINVYSYKDGYTYNLTR